MEDHRLRMFENKAVRRIHGPKTDILTGGSRTLYSDVLRNFYTLKNVISVTKSRQMRYVGHIICMLEMRDTNKNF
jgi:hypothetical protein